MNIRSCSKWTGRVSAISIFSKKGGRTRGSAPTKTLLSVIPASFPTKPGGNAESSDLFFGLCFWLIVSQGRPAVSPPSSALVNLAVATSMRRNDEQSQNHLPVRDSPFRTDVAQIHLPPGIHEPVPPTRVPRDSSSLYLRQVYRRPRNSR